MEFQITDHLVRSSALEREEIRADEIRGIESMLFNFRFFRRPREIYDFPYGEGEGRRVSLVAG